MSRQQLFSHPQRDSANAPFSHTVHISDRFIYLFMHFFSGTKHPREDNPNLYYRAEITGLHTQTFNI